MGELNTNRCHMFLWPGMSNSSLEGEVVRSEASFRVPGLAMAKLLFIPFGILGGLVAGFLGKKAFDGLWGLVDEEEPPEPEHRDVPWGKLLLASALQGAIFRATRAAAEHGSRRAFASVTGSWPGDEAPEP